MNGFLASIVTGLLAALGVTVLTWLTHRIRDSRVTRQYPVAGTYASSFEDLDSGEIVYTKAQATLFQRGQHVWGETEALNGGRRWTIDGQLSKSGRIYGTYKAEDPHDTGEGGFFLELAPQGRLDGVWAGFDSRNKKVTAGRYQFWPMKISHIRAMSSTDVPHGLALLGEELGRRYISKDDLDAFVDGESQFALVAEREKNIVAVITNEVLSNTEFFDEVPEDMRQPVESMIPYLEYEKVGLLKSMAVSKSHQGAGIGSELSERAVRILWERGVTCVIAIGWTTDKGCHVEGVVRGLGFSEAGILDDYWCKDSVLKNYHCPRCGQPCHCQAKIFILQRDT